MTQTRFVHLHVHTEFSLLQGTIRLPQLLEYCKAHEVDSIAITDNGVMFAVADFYLAAKSAGINPILGVELYLVQDRFSKDRDWSRLIVLAKNYRGYQMLSQLLSQAYIDGFYYRPRVDWELLEQYKEDLVAISPGYWGDIAMAFKYNNPQAAVDAINRYKAIFKDDFYLGLQFVGNPLEEVLAQEIVELAATHQVPIVACNDVYYYQKDDAILQVVARAIQQGKILSPEDELLENSESYLKSPQDMIELFAAYPEAIENTLEIAQKCKVELDVDRIQLPHFEVPEGYTAETFLKELVWQGLNKRYPEITDEIQTRMDHELKTINNMGFPVYFLIVYDIVRFCHKEDIPVGPGRGSAAGSIVAYALGITHIDPLKNKLLFERFLNPDRISMPDIDIDFCIDRRQDVIQYISDQYGEDHVAQIATFGTMQSRGVLRDVGRVLDIPLSQVDYIAKLIPAVPGQQVSIQEALETIPEFNKYYSSNSALKKWIDYSMRLEGLSRHSSTHAAGVVISYDPLSQIVPLMKNEGQIATQFTMNTLEKMGLLKMDILGLRNLTVIRQTLKNIKIYTGEVVDLDQISDDDEATYQNLSSGNTKGVFQLESEGMRQIIVDLLPSSFEDLVALLALYRPGPLGSGMVSAFISNKAGTTEAQYDLPQLEPVLKDTYGIILYQEQVMQIASVVGQFTLAQADMLRRAMGKKKKEEMDRLKATFIKGAQDQAIDGKVAEAIFDKCCKFAEYGFNKSHSAAYALISYQTAYLKTHYTQAYMAALLSSIYGQSDKVALYLNDLHQMKIQVLSPDINASEAMFSLEGKGIRFGLMAVKNVGLAVIEDMVANRKANGPYQSLMDFCTRVETVNKRVLEALIKVSAFACVEPNISTLLSTYESCLNRSQTIRKEKKSGQGSMFSGFIDTQIVDHLESANIHVDPSDQLRFEKEFLGVYLSGHPLDQYKDRVTKWNSQMISEDHVDELISILGFVIQVRRVLSKNKQEMIIAKLEDAHGEFDILLFSADDVEKFSEFLIEGRILMVTGKVRLSRDKASLNCQNIEVLDQMSKANAIHINMISIDPFGQFERIKQALIDSSGSCPVYIHWNHHEILVHKKYWASVSVIDSIKGICGEERVWVS